MDDIERAKRLEERIANAAERAQKAITEVKSLKKKLYALRSPDGKLTKKQQNTIKIWHGIACIELMKTHETFSANDIRNYLENHVKSPYQRKLLELPELQPKTQPAQKGEKKSWSTLFQCAAPVPAWERVELVVKNPYGADGDKGADKEAAKAAGALWDKDKKVWYVNKGFDLTLVEKWLPANRDWRKARLIG